MERKGIPQRVPVSFPKTRDRTFRKVFPFIDVGRWWWWWWVSNTKTSWKLERVRIEARNIRPSLKRRLEQRGGVSRLKHSARPFPPQLNVYCFVLFRPVAVGGRARHCLTGFYCNMNRETSYRVNPIFLLLPIPKGNRARSWNRRLYYLFLVDPKSIWSIGVVYKTAIFIEQMLYVRKLWKCEHSMWENFNFVKNRSGLTGRKDWKF